MNQVPEYKVFVRQFNRNNLSHNKLYPSLLPQAKLQDNSQMDRTLQNPLLKLVQISIDEVQGLKGLFPLMRP